jgi:hypothetical protein
MRKTKKRKEKETKNHLQNLAMPERKKEILEEDVYQPVIQEAKGLHFAPAN